MLEDKVELFDLVDLFNLCDPAGRHGYELMLYFNGEALPARTRTRETLSTRRDGNRPRHRAGR